MNTFSYFEILHFKALFLSIIIGLIIISLPFIIKGLEKTIYTRFIGITLIILQITMSFYKVYFENFSILESLPLYLCNITVILSGIYLIINKNIFFNIIYFFSLGALLAIFFPGISNYNNKLFIYIFMITHVGVIITIIYGFLHLKNYITKKGLYISLITYLILTLFIKIFNTIFNTNYMFLNDYILDFLRFIKPFYVYIFLLTISFTFSMIIMYLPFREGKK